MQAAASPFSPLPRITPLPQDHELKRQYLTLLPPQQIIDICLNFDLHVPPYIKSSIWPLDISAAITNLRKATTPSAGESSFQKTSNQEEAVMASLEKPPDPTPSSTTNNEPRPPDRHGSATLGLPSSQAETTTVATLCHRISHAAPGNLPPPPNPLFSNASTHQSHVPDQSGNDDLPSYEEMIVEALMDCGDPEGCAPKDLFTWMASRYPLQSNFRPSASQALQKAYKRGRFEKSTGGKYRLNASWEGGNTSRRTTRRPQTQSQSSAPSNSTTTSPFTHAPLVHHHHQQSQHPQQSPFIGQPFGFPFQHPQPMGGFGPYSSQSAPPSAAATTNNTIAVPEKAESTTSGDAYEAAQNILKAINFGSLLQLPTEDDAQKADDTAAVAVPSANEDTVHNLSTSIDIDSTTASSTSHLSTTSDLGAHMSIPNQPIVEVGTRAELQAQLALLAAQLAELSQEDDSAATELTNAIHIATSTSWSAPAVPVIPVLSSTRADISVHPSPISAPMSHSMSSFTASTISLVSTEQLEVPSTVPTSHVEESPSPRLFAIPQEEEDSSDDDDDDMEEVI
ncbi:hypothetical protein BDQ17DRAFT_1348121 [Cyathus striatus]|nr:hypothetical protein BDQ17DRAFT_1348121 [Cyathus striatus]